MGRPRTKPPAEDIKAPPGDRVRELREQRGLTQAQLAAAGNVSKVFLGAVERGEKAATVETLWKIARGLEIAPLELFRFEAKEAKAAPSDVLGRRIAAMTRGLSPGHLSRIERMVRLLLEPMREASDPRLGPETAAAGKAPKKKAKKKRR